MRLFAFFLIGLLCSAESASATENLPQAKIHIVVVLAEAGRAAKARTVEIPDGMTLSSFCKQPRPVDGERPLLMAQGSIELRRLPTPHRRGVSESYSCREISRGGKGKTSLENGDIIVSDAWPDY